MSPLRSNLDCYVDWIGAVEEVFGRKWLEKKQRVLLAGGSVHPVVSAWEAASRWIASAQHARNGELTAQLVCLFDMGSDLHTVKSLPGFAQAFPPRRLKNVEGWENDIYVAHVAALAVRTGYQVSFIPPARDEGVKTADLCLLCENRTYFVECKKKDRYFRSADADSAWPTVQRDLSALASTSAHDYEVIIACIGGLNLDARQSLVSAAKSIIDRSESGEIVVPEFDAVVLVQKDPPRPAGAEGAWIPAWQNPGSATVRVTVGTDGKPTSGPLFRSCLYLLDAHRSTQILSSLRDARSQIPHELSGAIFVAVDTTGVPDGDHDLYFSTLAVWLERELGRNDNARVLAVVLTGGIARVETTADGAFHRSVRHWRVVRNPNCRSDFVVPGERS